jgi:hypothetical protein
MGEVACIWRWAGIAWVNIEDTCVSPDTCVAPTADGNYVGQVAELPCQSS